MAKQPEATTTKAGQSSTTMASGAMSSIAAAVNDGAPVVEIEVPGSVGDDDIKPFPEEEIDHEAEASRTPLNMTEKEQYDHDHKMVWVRPRRNLVRTKIGSDWFTFAKGKEYQIKQWQADWLTEKGYL